MGLSEIWNDFEVAIGDRASPAVDAVNAAPLGDTYGAGGGTPEEWAAWIQRVFPGSNLKVVVYRAQAPVVAQAAGVPPDTSGDYSLVIKPNKTNYFFDDVRMVGVCSYPSGNIILQPTAVEEGQPLTVRSVASDYQDDLVVVTDEAGVTFSVTPHVNNYAPPTPKTPAEIAQGLLGNVEIILALALLIFVVIALNDSGRLKKG